jgi:SAF domain
MIGSKRSSSKSEEVGDRFEAIIASSGLVSRKANPKVMASGVAVVIVGALMGALAMGSGRDSHRVLVAARPIDAGDVVATADLRSIEVSGPPSFAATSPKQINALLGKVALSPIAQGAIITSDQVRNRQSAPPGSALVGVVLDPGALPTPDLRYGDLVEVMVSSSPNAVIDEPARVVTEATVWKVWGGSESGGRRAVTLAIPSDRVPEVGDAAARNLIRLVVIPSSDQLWPADLTASVRASSPSTKGTSTEPDTSVVEPVPANGSVTP